MTTITLKLLDTWGRDLKLPLLQAQRALTEYMQQHGFDLVPAPGKPLSGEELFALGDIGPTELVKGEIIYQMPTGFRHGIIEVHIAKALSNFVAPRALGYVLSGEVGLYTQHNPDTVRGLDAAFISTDRLAQSTSDSYLDVAPELIVEIMSPSDSWTDMNDKLAEYFELEVCQVWVVNPHRQQVHVYRALTDLTILNAQDILTAVDILPSFSILVADLFHPQ